MFVNTSLTFVNATVVVTLRAVKSMHFGFNFTVSTGYKFARFIDYHSRVFQALVA
jgi:hypothetical protein